jgi:hypothetical protein
MNEEATSQNSDDGWAFDINPPDSYEPVHTLKGGLFISHSSRDHGLIQASVLPVFEEIFEPMMYFYYNAERGGSFYARAVRTALWSCASVLVLISPNSLKSNWVRTEVRAAKDWGRKLEFAKLIPCDAEIANSFLSPEQLSSVIDISGDPRRAARRLRRLLFRLPPPLFHPSGEKLVGRARKTLQRFWMRRF